MCGGGYIGLELGLYAARMGARVTVIEAEKSLLPAVDADMVSVLRKSLEESGLTFVFGEKIAAIKEDQSGVTVSTDQQHLNGSHALLALGRTPFLESGAVCPSNKMSVAF